LKKLAILLFILVVAFDLLLLLLGLNQYYVAIIKYTGIIFPAFLTVLSIFIFVSTLGIKTAEKITISVIASLILAVMLFVHLIGDYQIDTITSPASKDTLIIEHRNATLGETTHLYYFYRNTACPGVIKKVNNKVLTIQTRESGQIPNDLEVLGVDNAEWIEGKGIIFHSHYATTKLDF